MSRSKAPVSISVAVCSLLTLECLTLAFQIPAQVSMPRLAIGPSDSALGDPPSDDQDSQDDQSNQDSNQDSDQDDQSDQQTSPAVQAAGAILSGYIAAKTGDVQTASQIAQASGMSQEQVQEIQQTDQQIVDNRAAALQQQQQQLDQQQAQQKQQYEEQQARLRAQEQAQQQQARQRATMNAVQQAAPQGKGRHVDNTYARSGCIVPGRPGIGGVDLENRCGGKIEVVLCSDDGSCYLANDDAVVGPHYAGAGMFTVGSEPQSSSVGSGHRFYYFACENDDGLTLPYLTSLDPIQGKCVRLN